MKVGGAYVEIQGKVDKLERDLAKARAETQRALGSMEDRAKKFADRMVTYIASGFAINRLTRFTAGLYEAGRSMNATEKAFREITGSAQATSAEVGFLRSLADRTGQSFYVLIDSYKGFLAASQKSNLEGEKTQEIFSAITAAAATLGLSSDQASGALYAVQQMMSKGTVSSEELRQQLGERLPGAFNLMAEAMGVSVAQLGKMLERGEVLADVALPKLARVLRQRYSGEVDSATEAQNKLSEAWQDFQVQLSQGVWLETAANSLMALADAARAVTSALEGPSTVDIFKKQQATIRTEIELTQNKLEMQQKLAEFGYFDADEKAAALEVKLEYLRRQHRIISESIRREMGGGGPAAGGGGGAPPPPMPDVAWTKDDLDPLLAKHEAMKEAENAYFQWKYDRTVEDMEREKALMEQMVEEMRDPLLMKQQGMMEADSAYWEWKSEQEEAAIEQTMAMDAQLREDKLSALIEEIENRQALEANYAEWRAETESSLAAYVVDMWMSANQQMTDAEKKKAQAAAGAAANMMDNWAYAFKVFGKESQTAWKAYQAFAIAQTIAETYTAAMGAYAAMAVIPIVGPTILAPMAAAAAIAAGAARVSAIASQSPSGGGSVSNAGFAVGSYSASPTTGLADFGDDDEKSKGAMTVNIYGDLLGDEYYIEKLAEKINSAVSDRQVTVIASYATEAGRLT